MPDSVTTLYKFTKPEIGGSDNTWGNKLNAGLDGVDRIFRDMGGTISTSGTGVAYTYTPLHVGSPDATGGDPALITGLLIRARIDEDNTNLNPTLKYGDLVAKPIRKQSLGQFVNLAVGDLQAGYIAELIYNSTAITGGCWIFLNPPPDDAIGNANQLCFHRNLVLDRTDATHIIIRADAAVLRSTAGGLRAFRVVSQPVDITLGGAGGRVNIARAPDTWYSIYLIAKSDGTVDAMLSGTNGSPGPTGGGAVALPSGFLPSGYTFYGFVGCARTNASQNFIDFRQAGNMASIVSAEADARPVPRGNNNFSNISLPLVPPEALAVRLSVNVRGNLGAGLLEVRVATGGSGVAAALGEIRLAGYYAFTSEAIVMMQTPQQVAARTLDFTQLSGPPTGGPAPLFQLFVNGYYL
jgi:hypothetical protein